MRFRTKLVVNLDKFASNLEKIKVIALQADPILMVKADGYGHGATALAQFAHHELGLNNFGLATLGEAIRLREDCPDAEFETYVFSDIQLKLKDHAETYLNNRLLPVLSNRADLKEVLTRPEYKHFPLCLKFNTGMNRLGFEVDEVGEIIDEVKKAGRRSIYHLMTHFACASLSMKTNPRNLLQQKNWQLVKNAFLSSGLDVERTSISNSGTIEQGYGVDETHIRPGLMLYGPSSLISSVKREGHYQGELISRLETYILSTFPVKRGTPVGYGAHPVSRDGLVVIIALGYGDGFSNYYRGGSLTQAGFRGEIIGRVNMDMTYLLFPIEAEKQLRAQMPFTVWGHDTADFERFCEEIETIPYEVFCHLTSRVPRFYEK